MHSLRLGSSRPCFFVPKQQGREKEKHNMNLNQLTIIGFLGKDAETKFLANGTPVTKFSVATQTSWKDRDGQWKERIQWHNVVAFGEGFVNMKARLTKGAHVFVQGELTTREYDRTITIQAGKKSTDHVVKQLVVECKADTVRSLDRSSASPDLNDAAEPPEMEAPA
jgi:single-strand DNA-binding protein